MTGRKSSPLVATGLAFLFVLLAIGVGWRLVRGDNSLLRNVVVEADRISPNADGQNDITKIRYELSRNATVSIYFEDEAGERYYFRQQQPRGAGEYEVFFSGVVAPYRLPDEVYQGELLARVLPDGAYLWVVEAVDESGNEAAVNGRLTIVDADTALPELRDFTVFPRQFTPNRDGIGDRVLIQFVQMKAGSVRVFLLDENGVEWPISEDERNIPRGQPGRRYYDYEGGVDSGATPPPDGTYPIIAIAEDAVGQRMRVEETITIAYGGVPRAQIYPPPIGDTFRLNTTAVSLCDSLTFTMTIENYGDTPIRTTGPTPGTMYDSDWNYNTIGWPTESGAWRVAVGYENELSNYPYRWAVGGPNDLTEIDGHLYLMPGARAVVTGSIRIVGSLGERNPQPMWAGLIHEDVEISQFNNRVDPHAVLIDMPGPDHRTACEPREIPVRQR